MQWWHAVQDHQHVKTSWETIQADGRVQVHATRATYRFPGTNRTRETICDAVRQDRDFLDEVVVDHGLDGRLNSVSRIPYIPKWIEPWESLNSEKTESIRFT